MIPDGYLDGCKQPHRFWFAGDGLLTVSPAGERTRRPRLSVVAPCHNEEAVVEEFHRRISAAARDVVADDYELILLNDGSSDRTWELIRTLSASDRAVVGINLARRHGHQLA